MAPERSKVMVVGGSGNIGTVIIDYLLKYPQHFAVSALTRPTSKSTFAPDVEVVRTGYSLDELTAAFQGQDIVICTISTSSLSDQMTIAKAAIAAKVKRFVPAEMGMDTDDEIGRDVIALLRKTEDTTSWAGHFTGLWIDFSLISPDWLWWSLKDKMMTIFDNGDVPFETTTLDRAAETVVKSLLPEHYGATRNSFVYARSAVYTPNQLFGYLKKYVGGEWQVDHRDISILASEGQKAFYEEINSGQPSEVVGKSKKLFDSIITMVSAALMGNGGVNQFGDKPKPWMDELGIVEEDPEEIIKRTVQQWKAGKLDSWSK